jgi:hypothetical protein
LLDQPDQLVVIETVEGVREQHQRGQQCHHPRITEGECRGL